MFRKFILSLTLCTSTLIITKEQKKLSPLATITTYADEDKWMYLEYIFAVKPNNDFQCTMQHSQNIGALLSAAFLAKTYLLSNENSKTPSLSQLAKNQDFFTKILTILSLFSIGSTGYNYFTCYTNKKINFESLRNFLNLWPVHNDFIPEEFTSFFDEMYESYLQYGDLFLTDDLVSDVFQLVYHHLEHHFKDRYKHEAIKPETPMSKLKTMTDILKNIN